MSRPRVKRHGLVRLPNRGAIGVYRYEDGARRVTFVCGDVRATIDLSVEAGQELACLLFDDPPVTAEEFSAALRARMEVAG